jgi:hypothetical protein
MDNYTTIVRQLKHRQVFVSGKYDGINFCRGSEDKRNFEPKPLDVLKASQDDFLKSPTSVPIPDRIYGSYIYYLTLDPQDVLVYRKGFLEGLRDVISVITDKPEGNHGSILFGQRLKVEGMQNGMEFAWVEFDLKDKNKDGDINLIKGEIEKDENLIARNVARGKWPDQIGARLRLYHDSRIQGLKEAVEIIEKLLQNKHNPDE